MNTVDAEKHFVKFSKKFLNEVLGQPSLKDYEDFKNRLIKLNSQRIGASNEEESRRKNALLVKQMVEEVMNHIESYPDTFPNEDVNRRTIEFCLIMLKCLPVM